MRKKEDLGRLPLCINYSLHFRLKKNCDYATIKKNVRQYMFRKSSVFNIKITFHK